MKGQGKGGGSGASAPGKPGRGGVPTREDRLKAALRANLRRRKTLPMDRCGAGTDTGANDPGHPGDEDEGRTDG